MYNSQLKSIELPQLRRAKIPNMFDFVQVVIGSEETIFDETYVTAVIGTDRIVKFKKSVVQYT